MHDIRKVTIKQLIQTPVDISIEITREL